MKLTSYIITVVLLFFSFQSASRNAVDISKYPPNFCKVINGSTDVKIPIGDINIAPGASVGTIIASSDLISKELVCESKNSAGIDSFPTSAFADVGGVLTGVSINGHSLPDSIFQNAGISKPGNNCSVIESTVKGVGYAWFNYNSGTGAWACPTDGNVVRGLGDKRTIYDIIVLVKVGDVTTTTDDGVSFNKKFQFNEKCDNNVLNGDRRPSNCPSLIGGDLYNIYIDSKIKINSPKCSISKESEFNILQTNNLSTQNSMTAKVSCVNGLIENGQSILFDIETPLGLFTLDNNYYATSSPGLGISIEYKMKGDSSYKKLLTKDNTLEIKMPVAAGDKEPKADVEFKYTPYIKEDSGVYPIVDDIHFDLNLTNE